MLELYQTEWCPFSRKVRERLTELGLSYVIHQAPPHPEQREELRRLSGDTTIPVLVGEDGETVRGTEEILAALDGRYPEPASAAGQREQARAHGM
jgi:glutathione S-transferase